MKLGAAEREILFGTPSLTEQIKVYLSKQPGRTSSKDDLSKVFSELSPGRFLSTLLVLKTRGEIAEKDGSVTLIADKAREQTMSEMVWKAVRMDRTCTVENVAMETGLAKLQVRRIFNGFEKKGLIRAAYRRKGKPTVFILLSDTAVRLQAARKRREGVEAVWNAIRDIDGVFTLADVRKKVPPSLSRSYVQQLLRQYRQDGFLELVAGGRAKAWVYRKAGQLDKAAPAVREQISDRTLGENG